MIILGIVMVGLTTMFAAGLRAETRAHREFRAQQTARIALDQIRHELHCANSITATEATPVSSIAVTLPDGCWGSDENIVYATEAVAGSRWRLNRTGDSGTAVQVADYLTASDVFTYYGPATGTLGRLHLEIPVNVEPADATSEWRLEDDIVLRNSIRQ
jgi:hypothetical protein